MKKLLILFVLFSLTIGLNAQDAAFSVSVDRQNVLMDNPFQVTFNLENISSRNFETPVFKDFDILSTSQSTQTSIINGDMTRSTGFTYILMPKGVGTYFIEPVTLEVDDKIFETQPIEITVLDNPDNTKEEIKGKGDDSFFFFRNETFPTPPTPPSNPKPKKKKRKTYKL